MSLQNRAALELVRRLHALTQGRPAQWRMLHDLDVGEDSPAVRAAVDAGWLEVQMHSGQLTEKGRRVARATAAG